MVPLQRFGRKISREVIFGEFDGGEAGSVDGDAGTDGPLKHNLATICERYWGGGHPRVGAISFPIGGVEEARKAAAEIREELKG